MTERSLPVVLEQVRVISLVHGARTGSGISVLDFWWWHIVLVASNANGLLERAPDFGAASLDVSHEFINHNYYL